MRMVRVVATRMTGSATTARCRLRTVFGNRNSLDLDTNRKCVVLWNVD